MATLAVKVKGEVVSPQPVRQRPQNGPHPRADSRQDMLSLAEFIGPIEEAGGCMQLLCNRVAKDSEEVLAQRLGSFFEQRRDLSYSGKDMPQMDDDKEHLFRLVDLGYASQATTKGPPRLHTCISLCDSMFTDGLVTQGDPLMIWKNPQTMQLAFFWICFIKGHARACTALAMALIVMFCFLRCSCIDSSWRRKPPRKSQGHPHAGCHC